MEQYRSWISAVQPMFKSYGFNFNHLTGKIFIFILKIWIANLCSFYKKQVMKINGS